MKRLVYLVLLLTVMCSCGPTKSDVARIRMQVVNEQLDAYTKELKEYTLIPKKPGLEALKIIAKEKQQIRYEKREDGKIQTEFTPYWAIIHKDRIIFTYHMDDYSVMEEYAKL